MFWWTWSLRRRVALLTLLAAPLLTAVVLLIAPRVGGGDETADSVSSTTVTVETTIVETPTTVASPVTSVPTDSTGTAQSLTSPVRVGVKLTPTAFELLPETFKLAANAQLVDIVLPGAGPDDRSVYAIHTTKDWAATAESYAAHFKSKGLAVTQRAADGYVELQVSGTEGTRRFRAALRVIASGETAIVVGLVSFLDPL